MDGTMMVALAVALFVASHLALSHPLRAPLVKVLGNGGFAGLYAVVSLAALWWISKTYKDAPLTPPLWDVGDGLWALGSLIMLVASVLLVG